MRREVDLDEKAPVELLLLQPRRPLDLLGQLTRPGAASARPGWLDLFAHPKPLAWWPDSLNFR